jgi:hypothetical protein
MSAEIVNLNTYRKAKKKADKKRKAAENRRRFGRDKAEQRRREYEKAAQETQFDGNRLDEDN